MHVQIQSRFVAHPPMEPLPLSSRRPDRHLAILLGFTLLMLRPASYPPQLEVLNAAGTSEIDDVVVPNRYSLQ